MRAHNTGREASLRMDSALVGAHSGTSGARSASIHFLPTRVGQPRAFVRSTQAPPALRNEMAEVVADIDGLPILVRFLVEDVPADIQSSACSGEADIHALLSKTLETMVGRMRGSPLRNGDSSKQPLATVELISSGEPLRRLRAMLNETVLRVGSLELDLVDRTAKRGDRQIVLRPREFQLLKYMMQRSDKLLTRENLFKEVWNYKFVPETNLVDVHMGRLRRKVDGANEIPMIRNVRGAGFVLSATPLLKGSPARPA
jgi:DNA-binding winged helix-turn-helix (wHTH) protein